MMEAESIIVVNWCHATSLDTAVRPKSRTEPPVSRAHNGLPSYAPGNAAPGKPHRPLCCVSSLSGLSHINQEEDIHTG